MNRRGLLKAGAVAAATVGALTAGARPAAGAAAGGRNYWVGDSIGTSWWSSNPDRDSPPGRLSVELLAQGRKPITNLSVGGMGMHFPYGQPNRGLVAFDVIDRTLPADADVVVIALGANDIGGHALAEELYGDPAWYGTYVDYLKYEMIRIDELARSRARRVVWQTILPVCAGGFCTEPLPPQMGRGLIQWYDVWPWTLRLQNVNAWITRMWPDRVADVSAAMRPDGGVGDPRLYFDGLHPTQWGCQRIADEFPIRYFD